jgi:CRP-like cAMP-binding protein
VEADDHPFVHFPRGAQLFRQGEPGGTVYILKAGAVALYRESQDRRTPLATVRDGEMFGEMAAVDGSPRLASAVALEDSTVMVVPAAAMREKLHDADPFLRSLIRMLSGSLRNIHDTYTPKSRSLLDSVNSLSRQYDVVHRLLQTNLAPDFRAALSGRLRQLDALVKDLRRVAMAHREQDRRDDAVPHEADLPR